VLEEAAVEAGLSRESVRRAVAELRAGALAAADAAPARRKGLGPATVTVSRCVPGPFSDVDGILRRFLAKEQFHLRRDFGTNYLWARRQDVRARVKVQYDRSIHRRLMLRDVEQVEMAVVEEPGDRGMVMVKLTVDVRSILHEHRQAVAKGAGVGLTVAALGTVVLGMPEAAVVVPGATASGVAIGHRLGLKQVRTTVEDLTTRVEGFLDGVERRRA
jgi:hypothetical protein